MVRQLEIVGAVWLCEIHIHLYHALDVELHFVGLYGDCTKDAFMYAVRSHVQLAMQV